jgi:hypothetical protein
LSSSENFSLEPIAQNGNEGDLVMLEKKGLLSLAEKKQTTRTAETKAKTYLESAMILESQDGN